MNSFLVTERIGETRYLTPDGFLLVRSVPIARSGDLEYREAEVPPLKGINGKVVLHRPAEELFNPETIGSFEAKPILDGFHRIVTPQNYKDISVGSITNVRKGDGEQSDFLVADLLVMDGSTISRIQNNVIKEVSIGFNSEYDQTEMGRGIQTHIRGNHIAIVPQTEGRAGACCALGDSDQKGENVMAEEVKEISKETQELPPGGAESVTMGVLKGLADMFGLGKRGGDQMEAGASGLEERIARLEEAIARLIPAEKEEPPSFDSRLGALEDSIGELMKSLSTGEISGTRTVTTATATGEDDAGSAPVGDAEVEIELSEEDVDEGSEVLVPGSERPEGDAGGLDTFIASTLVKCADFNNSVHSMIQSTIGEKRQVSDVAKLPKPVLRTLFKSAVASVKAQNNVATVSGLNRVYKAMGDAKVENDFHNPLSGADLQAIVNKAYGRVEQTLV